MGMLPEAMRNYLLRLGWGHGDEEIVPTERAIELFDLDGVGRSPARFDMTRLTSLNAHYLRALADSELVTRLAPWLDRPDYRRDDEAMAWLEAGMDGLKQRARTLVELGDAAGLYLSQRPLALDPKARALLDPPTRERLDALRGALAGLEAWDEAALEAACRAAAEQAGVGFGKLAQPLRAALTGRTVSPGLFELMRILGREEVLGRIEDAVAERNPRLSAVPN